MISLICIIIAQNKDNWLIDGFVCVPSLSMEGYYTARQFEMVAVAHEPPPPRVQVEAQEGATLWNAEYPVCLLSQVWSAGEQLCHRLGLLASQAQPHLPSQSLHLKGSQGKGRGQ